MTKRRSLGRGLEALLSASGQGESHASRTNLRELPVDLLSRGQFQPRVDMHEDTLKELAESIRVQGIVQPIVVRPTAKSNGETRYEIVAGERRWRAAQLAGLATVPALVRDIPDEAAVAVALIENIQRENLNPIEEARSLARLVQQFEMTHAEAAEAVGRSRAAVSNLLRLLELPEVVSRLLETRQLDMGHARALLGIESPEAMAELAQRAARDGWSVRETERAVRRLAGTKPGKKLKKGKDPNVRRLETELGETLGAAVTIEGGDKGGRIVIRYGSLDELDGILAHIK
ncbi:MAG TPA: ParB/RepB/Spo0J family partition protein [Gammaproteobacteria bacterium]|nr:ParB/RepB/Spo0J family partition protein [Gammaproteobacteria bacterium]